MIKSHLLYQLSCTPVFHMETERVIYGNHRHMSSILRCADSVSTPIFLCGAYICVWSVWWVSDIEKSLSDHFDCLFSRLLVMTHPALVGCVEIRKGLLKLGAFLVDLVDDV